MASETLKKRTFTTIVENGQTSTGNMKLASISMGAISKDRWDADKAVAIAAALEPCLNNVIAGLETTAVMSLTAG